MNRPSFCLFLSVLLLLCAAPACQGPRPTYFPPAPLRTADGDLPLRYYDTNGDQYADYAERIGAAGRIDRLGFDHGKGDFSDVVSLAEARRGTARHLLIILDSVPFSLVERMWQQGHLRLFHPPQRIISPFPVMTDPALADFFGTEATPAVEASHARDGRLTDGMRLYMREENSPWIAYVDYHLPPNQHGYAYMFPQAWLQRELHGIERALAARDELVVGYVVSTSGIGMHRGATGHQQAMLLVERFCQMLTHKYRGALHITLMSDHGHAFATHQRIRLGKTLARCGFHGGKRLRGPYDFVTPEFGLVSMAAVYTPSPEPIGRTLAGMAGIDLVAFPVAKDAVEVRSAAGCARIERTAGGYRYLCEFGDPLRLTEILEALEAQGTLHADGSIDDAALFAATSAHEYPDPLDRLWRAWHGLLQRPPGIIVSLSEGWLSGSGFFLNFMDVHASHGSLRQASSTGFLMSTAGRLEQPVRMRDAKRAWEQLSNPAAQRSRQAPVADAGVVH